MNNDELPEYTAPFLTGSWNPLEAVAMGEFTGPNWSDGKRQGSTSKGERQATSQLDVLSKAHDSAYAVSGDLDSLTEADLAYWRDSRRMSFVPRVVGMLPYYGNMVGRSVAKTLGMEYIGSEHPSGKMNYNAKFGPLGSETTTTRANSERNYLQSLRGSSVDSGETPDSADFAKPLIYAPTETQSNMPIQSNKQVSRSFNAPRDQDSYMRQMVKLFPPSQRLHSFYKNRRSKRNKVYMCDA